MQTEADLLDYDDEEAADEQANETAVEGGEKKNTGAYVSIHSSGFRDFLLKPELMKAIVDCGFEHPSAGESRSRPFFGVPFPIFSGVYGGKTILFGTGLQFYE